MAVGQPVPALRLGLPAVSGGAESGSPRPQTPGPGGGPTLSAVTPPPT